MVGDVGGGPSRGQLHSQAAQELGFFPCPDQQHPIGARGLAVESTAVLTEPHACIRLSGWPS